MRKNIDKGWCVLVALALGCGGGAQQVERDPEPVETGVVEETPAPAPEPAPEPEDAAEASSELEGDAPLERTAAPDQPPTEPFTATNADEVKAALTAAASDIFAFKRLVDPLRGVGVFDAEESNVQQYCDVEHLGTHAGLGFVMGIEDRFQCDNRLRRCMNRSREGSGTVFYLREGEGDVVYVDTVVQYARRVPNSDNRSVVTFANGGEGVCALHRQTTGIGTAPVDHLSVFVSSQTGLVPEVLAQHLCGDEAHAAYQERISPLGGTTPARCDRNPSRCTWASGDEEITVYGDDDGNPTMVTVTRPGMMANLARAQQHDVDVFMAAARRHRCEDAGEE